MAGGFTASTATGAVDALGAIAGAGFFVDMNGLIYLTMYIVYTVNDECQKQSFKRLIQPKSTAFFARPILLHAVSMQTGEMLEPSQPYS